MKSMKIITGLVVALALVGGGVWYRTHAKDSTQTAVAADKGISYNCESGKTAYDLLAEKYSLDTKDTSYGKQIMGINGIKPSDTEFWSFDIDGQAATVGAESYTCKGNEKISWQLEAF